MTKEEEERLRLYARQIVEGLEANDPDHVSLHEHLASDFRAVNSATGSLVNLQDFLAHAYGGSGGSSYTIRIQSEQVDIDKGASLTHAVVWQFGSVSGNPTGITNDGMIMTRWRLENRDWQCYHLERLRGNAGVSGFQYQS